MTKKIIIYVTLIYNIALNNNISAQDTIFYTVPNIFGFENLDADTLSNAYLLNPFFEDLYQMNTSPSKITFFHIGDSHLQADYISHTIRTKLQRNFGNAGRGLIAPLKLANTNESFNYQIKSNNIWKRQLIISKKPILPLGISGVTIQTKDTIGKIKLKSFNTDSIDYSFNKVGIIYDTDSSFHYSIKDSSSTWNQTSSYEFSSNKLTNEIEINFLKVDSTQSKATIYGFNLENNQPGIVYHSCGINGAKYTDYNKKTNFIQQIPVLKPNIIIISLGTNESFRPDFDTLSFYKEIDTLVNNIKSISAQTKIILTTPACSFKNFKKNNNLTLVSKTIVKYAIENKLPYWDLFEITGGENSAINWKKNLLLSRDGVHYTKEGYILQGNLFVIAFLKSYNQHVKHRLQ
jgi:hypothetical protein